MSKQKLTGIEQAEQERLQQATDNAPVVEIHPLTGKPKRKKVAILGFASTWNLAPFADPEFEI